MNLQELQWNWNQFGKVDPLYAILTNPEKKENRWNEDEFFETGKNEVKAAIDSLEFLNPPLTFGRALDFGCGVGRLTQALCRHFEKCDGVDIALSMVELARQFNKFGDRCQYHVNTMDNLQLFDADIFDFIYSMIVLQHIEPRYTVQYIEEFIRVLKPGGIAVFQIPSEPLISPSEPLPESAYNAKITPADYPTKMFPGEKTQIRVRLQNMSVVKWPGANGCLLKHPIRLGNHWLGSDGSIVKINDGRRTLDGDLGPMEEIELELTVTAPPNPGEYILEIDMVQENICWFHQKKSPTARLSVHIIADLAVSGDHVKSVPSGISPRAEMHCIPRETVVELIKSKGASIVDIADDFMARPAYTGYRYCIRK
jgi:SAM-dependent methyltransferase